jgi:hypothetical protein
LENTRVAFGEYLGTQADYGLVEKKNDGYYVRFLDFALNIEYWVFLHSVALGHAFRNNLRVPALLLAAVGSEEALEKSFYDVAKQVMTKFEKQPGLYELWLSTMPTGCDFSEVKLLKKMHESRVLLDQMTERLTSACLVGCGVGSTYPAEAEQMWAQGLGGPAEIWKKAWAEGLDIPEIEGAYTLEDAERIVRAVARQYAAEFLPELLKEL